MINKKNIIIFIGILFIPIIWGVLFSNIFNLHYVDAKYLFLGIIISILSIIAIFKTEKFAKNISNNIEMKMIKYLWILMLALSLFLITSSLEKLELKEVYCENLEFGSKWQYSSITRYNCGEEYYTTSIWNMETNCSYQLYIKVGSQEIYDYKLLKCNYNNLK